MVYGGDVVKVVYARVCVVSARLNLIERYGVWKWWIVTMSGQSFGIFDESMTAANGKLEMEIACREDN